MDAAREVAPNLRAMDDLVESLVLTARSLPAPEDAEELMDLAWRVAELAEDVRIQLWEL